MFRGKFESKTFAEARALKDKPIASPQLQRREENIPDKELLLNPMKRLDSFKTTDERNPYEPSYTQAYSPYRDNVKEQPKKELLNNDEDMWRSKYNQNYPLRSEFEKNRKRTEKLEETDSNDFQWVS